MCTRVRDTLEQGLRGPSEAGQAGRLRRDLSRVAAERQLFSLANGDGAHG
jgi:hypothetical protein